MSVLIPSDKVRVNKENINKLLLNEVCAGTAFKLMIFMNSSNCTLDESSHQATKFIKIEEVFITKIFTAQEQEVKRIWTNFCHFISWSIMADLQTFLRCYS